MSRSLSGALAIVSLFVACRNAPSSGNEPGSSSSSSVADSCGVGLDIAPSAAVAVVDGVEIPCSELFSYISASSLAAQVEFQQQLRTIEQGGLSDLINEKLLGAAAEKKKVTVKELIATTLSVEPSTEEEMAAFYKQAIERGEPLPAYEQVKSDLRAFLTEQKQKGALRDYRASLRSEALVEYLLPITVPPVFAVEAKGPFMGPVNAPVTIVEFSDYQCPYCAKAEPILERLLKTYSGKLRLVARDFPLPGHTNASKAAEATHCAEREEKFWPMHNLLFKNQGALGLKNLSDYANRLGLDSDKFSLCMSRDETRAVVVASMKAGAALGVSGTPTFFVNGRMLSGAQTYERFVELIDYELRSEFSNSASTTLVPKKL